jgi:hypothetical protein
VENEIAKLNEKRKLSVEKEEKEPPLKKRKILVDAEPTIKREILSAEDLKVILPNEKEESNDRSERVNQIKRAFTALGQSVEIRLKWLKHRQTIFGAAAFKRGSPSTTVGDNDFIRFLLGLKTAEDVTDIHRANADLILEVTTVARALNHVYNEGRE